MPFKNTAITQCILVWDIVNGVGKTGQSGTLTLRGVGDGSEFTPSSPSVTEIDSTNLKGVYSVSLTAGENNYTNVLLGGICSTTGCLIQPISWCNESDANLTKIAGSAVATSSAQLGVNIVNLGGSAVQASGGYIKISEGVGTGQLDLTGGRPGIDWAKVTNPTATEVLSGTTIGTVTTLTNAPADSTTLTEINADVDEIIATLGVAGAGLTAIGDTRIANLDATVSSRTKPADTQAAVTLVTTTTTLTNDPTGVTTLLGRLTATRAGYLDLLNTIPADVWSYVTRTITSGGITAAQVWDYLTSSIVTVGSIGKLLKDDIDAAISTRATPAQVQTSVASELDTAGTELSTMPNSATATIRQKLSFLYQYFKFRRTATQTVETMYKDNGTTSLGDASISNTGTTFDKGEMS